MLSDHDRQEVMRYHDGEMTPPERAVFERRLEACPECRAALDELVNLTEVTTDMRIADVPRTVWDTYWTGIYNRIERSVAWFLFILGNVMLAGYALFEMFTDPSVESFVRLGTVLVIVGFAILLLSVIREKSAVNRADRYQSEVQR